MAKKKAKKGEQLDLIDVTPEAAKPIIAQVKVYKKFQKARLENGKREVEEKAKTLTLVEASEIKADAKGIIKFEYEGTTVAVTPRDALITITEKKKAKANDD